MSQMAYKPWLESKRLSSTTRASSDRLNRTSQRCSQRSITGLWCPGKLYGIQQGTTRAETLRLATKTTARTLSFGKEIEEHTIQQGSVRVNNGMQQDIGELATQNSPLSSPKALESTAPWEESIASWEESTAHQCTKVKSDLATVMGNPAPDSVKRGLNTEELGSKLTAWEGILLEIVFCPLDPRESGNTTGIRQHASIQCLIQT
ncbi:hypothetical protein R3P38DRAFT_2816303 [Favolaschia claudopus]|uniref:Uncharacterized protein n=1 Tax=Favolaschia claudopus TaxID=2862362 RepID=A0AAV9YZ70_9AGAR